MCSRELLSSLQDLSYIEKFFYGLSKACGMQIFNGPYVKTPESFDPENKYLPVIDALFDLDYSDPEEVFRAGLSLRRTMAEAIREGCGNRVAQSYTPAQREQIQLIHGKYEVALDYKFVDDLLNGRADNPDQYLLQSVYNRLSAMEAIAAGMIGEKPVVHIGTGWPGTAIGLYRQFGIPVMCVEKDEEFAPISC